MARLSFEDWMKAVNKLVIREFGLSTDDLPDCCYRDWYDDGVTPARAAKRAIRCAAE